MTRLGRPTALALSAGLVLSSFAVAPAALAKPSDAPVIAREGAAVTPAGEGELTAAFTLAQTARQKATIKDLAATGNARSRAARFESAKPDPAHRDAVLAWASAHEFRVQHSSRFLVNVVGDGPDLAAALGTTLGSAVKNGKTYPVPAGPLVVPAELTDDIAAVTGLDDRPVYRNHAHFPSSPPYLPADLRAMSTTPVRTSTAGTGVTVGTVNFSGWNKSDLTTWAADPDDHPATNDAITIGADQITEVPLLGVNTVDTSGADGGFEVALDAEAILGVAPAAKQRLYFTPNSSAGALAMWDQMATDAASGLLDVASSSWGACESDYDDGAVIGQPHPLDVEGARIDTLVAAGATLFVASGDGGAYDCDYGSGSAPAYEVSVDFPASNPATVAVGGTSTQPGSSPFTYTHSGWSGSGGGYSHHFSKPLWQPDDINDSHRQVPDISALADPDTGMIGFITVDPGPGPPVQDYFILGGTSLAAPLSAAGLAVALAANNLTSGIGNILPTLYSHPEVWKDVVGGSNGVYTAGVGNDRVTGLGIMDWTAFSQTITIPPPSFTVPAFSKTAAVPLSVGGATANFKSWRLTEGAPTPDDCTGNDLTSKPTSSSPLTPGPHTLVLKALDVKDFCHSATRTVFVDLVKPSLTSVSATFIGTTTPKFRLSWVPKDDLPSSGFAPHYGRLYDDSDGVTAATFTTSLTSREYTLKPAHWYTLTVTVKDKAGNTGTLSKKFVAPRDDRSFVSSGFIRQSSFRDYMGTHSYGDRAGSYAKFSFTGKTATLTVIKTANSGYMDVYVDGARTARINLYRSSTAYRQRVRVATFPTVGRHTVLLKPVGRHQAGATGNRVHVDSVIVEK